MLKRNKTYISLTGDPIDISESRGAYLWRILKVPIIALFTAVGLGVTYFISDKVKGLLDQFWSTL